MNRFIRNVCQGLLLLAAACALQAQSLVVGVQAGYTNGGSGANLTVGDPVNVTVTGTGNQEQTAQFEMLPDSPMMININTANVSSYQVVFNPPTGYTMVIGGVRKSGLSGASGPGAVKVSITKREQGTASDAPAGDASSIQWVPPTTAETPRTPFLSFNIGVGKNGESLPPLRIPIFKRTTSTPDNIVPPDSPDVTSHSAVDGGMEFSVPQMDVKLEVSSANDGNFDLKFFPPGDSTAFVAYRFEVVSWAGDNFNQLKKVRILKAVPGAELDNPQSDKILETTLEGYFGESGIYLVNGTWTIEDWHRTGTSPLSVTTGLRSRALTGNTIVPTEFRVTTVYTDAVEVKPSAGSGTIASKVENQYNNFTIGANGDFADIIIPKQTINGVGDGNYLSETLTNPNLDYVRGGRAATGAVSLEADGGTGTQLVKTVYNTWLDSSPGITSSNGVYSLNVNGAMTTDTYREMDSKWVAFDWPSIIERKVGTTLLAKSAFYRSEFTGPGSHRIVETLRRDYSTASNYIESVTKHFRPDVSDCALRGRIYSMQAATGAKQSFAYTAQGFGGTGWTANYRVVVLSGATAGGTTVDGVDGVSVDALQMHANRSTKTIEYLSDGRLVRREVWVFTGGGGSSPVFNGGGSEPLAWETFSYTADGRLISRLTSAGAKYEANWDGNRKTWQKDETQLQTNFTHDAMDRVSVMERNAATGVAAQRKEIEYDAASRVRYTRVGSYGGEQLVTEFEYDRGGRTKRMRVPGQNTTSSAGTIITDFIYTNGGRDVQTNFNVGTAQVATSYLVNHIDGRIKSRTGNAAVEERYTYDFDGASRQRVTRKSGPLQKRMRIGVVDLLGRQVEERIDGFGVNGNQKPLVAYFEYNSGGQLSKSYSVEHGSNFHITGDMLSEYDQFGALKASGLDLNANGVLDPGGIDRFTASEIAYVYDGGAWWSRSIQKRYHTDNSSTGFHETRSDSRLTGLSGGHLGTMSQSVQRDAWGGLSTTTVVLDLVSNGHRVRTKLVDSSTQERLVVAGLTVNERWFDDNDQGLSGTPTLSTSYTYDAQSRLTHVTDGRTGTATTNYWYGTNFPREHYDARAVLIASYTYDGAGRQASDTTPAGTKNFSYSSRGELYEESGSSSHPSRRVYTDYGELKELRTYRNGIGGTADVTTWSYDDNTGWLVGRSDATNALVSYDYAFVSGYKEVVAHSARNPGAPTTTRYSLSTGDLIKIDYTDGTADIDFLAYNRDGTLRQVQDATGVRTLSYQNGQLTSEVLPAWFNNLVVTQDYHASTSTGANTVAGRYHRWKLGTGGDADREMSVTYGYDNLGRVSGITADYKAQGARSALNVPASYTYKPNSSLWETFTQGSFGASRAFENNRDVLTSITSTYSGIGTVTTFGYGTDNAGRREWATQAGMAFGDFVDSASDATYYRYTYNSVSELESATGYRGTDPSEALSPLPGRAFSYAYDTAGNRKTVGVSGDGVSYRDQPNGGGGVGANSLNQVRSRGTLRTRVSGTAHKDAAVTVGGNAVTREANPGRYWDFALSNYQQYASYNINATKAGSTPANGSVQALTRPATETLDYDADGNLTGDGVWTYEWDAENRLKRMFTHGTALGWGAPNRELLFTYDYIGRRVGKVSKENGTTIRDHKYIYSGWSLMAELDAATNKIVRSYAWGLDIDSSLGGTGGVGGLVLETLHSDTLLTTYHVSYDGNGNVTALVNRETNQVAASYEYGPFGENVRTQTFDANLLAHDQPFRFSTKFTDRETGLVYYGHRYYDPSLGRFINRDPIGEAGGLNLYGFTDNGPTNKVDFLGLQETHPNERGPRVYVDNIDITILIYPPDIDEGSSPSDGSHADRKLNHPSIPDRRVGAVNDRNEQITDAPRIESRSRTGRWVRFGIGALLAWIHDNNPNPFAPEPVFSDPDEQDGAMFGHGVAILTGAAEMQIGGTVVAGSGAAEVVTVGTATPVAVPAAVGGTVLAGHGAITTYKGLRNAVEMRQQRGGGIGRYNDVKGHHVHAKSAFKDHAKYKPGEGWSISQEYMKAKGWNHQRMTNYQRKAFADMKAGRRPNTLEEHNKIAIEALEAGGASRAEAVELATQSLGNLFQQGVKTPSNIPWAR